MFRVIDVFLSGVIDMHLVKFSTGLTCRIWYFECTMITIGSHFKFYILFKISFLITAPLSFKVLNFLALPIFYLLSRRSR